VARGSFWSGLGYLGNQFLRFAGNLILWRLLFEEAFGVMALVNVFLQALGMFSDVGIGPSLIQNKRGDDPRFVNTAWTIQTIRGLIIWLVSLVAAVPVAEFYGRPELVYLVPVVGLTGVVDGLASSKIFTEQRHLELKRVALVELSSQAAGTVAMIVWALIHPSVWALAIGGLTISIVKTVLSHVVLRGIPNRFRWEKLAAHDLMTFGRWVFFSTLLTFVAIQSDRLIFGKLVTMAELGVYSIAQIYATLPAFAMGHIVGTVVFPALSREVNEGGSLESAYGKIRTPALILSAWMVTCLLAGGQPLIEFLYDERAVDAGPIVQILALGGWFLMLETVNAAALLSLGQPKWLAFANMAKVIGMAVLIPVGFMTWGFTGAIVGFAAADVFKYVVSATATTRHRIGTWAQDFALTAGVLLAAVPGLGVHELARSQGLHPLPEGLLILLVVSVFWGLIFLVYRKRKKERKEGQPT